MIVTIAAAMPATAKAPEGPRATIASSSCSSIPSSGWGVLGSLMAVSLRKDLAQLVRLCGAYGRSRVVPGDADVGDDGSHLFVIEQVREGRHAVGPLVLRGSRCVAAVEHHADRVDRRAHRDGLIVRQRREGRRLSLALVAVAGCALLLVDAP